MKKDQYIPHEVSSRSCSEIMQLIEGQGMAGYGIYWGIMEYLRTQDNYVGDIRVLKTLARQMKTSVGKLMKVLNDYDLFSISGNSFRSRKLDVLMKPLENKRKAMEALSNHNRGTNTKQNACKPLKIKDASDTVKKSKEEKSKVSSSDDADAVPSLPSLPAWERYVDELRSEEQWKEIMAMRSGMGQVFLQRFDEVLHYFKQHVQAVGGERQILSPGDAKRYFCFYLTPGSTTFRNLTVLLKETEGKDPYRFEDRDPVTGSRSYCGVAIPVNAPPRPNNQAVWNPFSGEWN